MSHDTHLSLAAEAHDAETARRQQPIGSNERIILAAIDLAGWEFGPGEDLRQWSVADETRFLADWQALRDAVASLTAPWSTS
ncbi:hypothetical protein ACFP63_08830 [Oerskovia jenensis]|uniref:Uncharacterized protein n=1 Tax=Oerskovia jenensis TaxID=162169 RepID=A0ABS2LIB5_9CELL|nr:hypothetical protein [Oerskovia jenensis]MBM7480158.1 hypothetical protein [Oerskovia jenensis]